MVPRYLAVIDQGWCARMQERLWPTFKDACHDYFANVSQGVQGRPWGPARTLTTKSEIFSYEYDGVLSGYAHMKAQGWPDQVCLEDFTEAEKYALAGAGMSAPCVAMVLAAYYANPVAPWWS